MIHELGNISSGKQTGEWGNTTGKLVVRRVGQEKEVISKEIMRVHWRKVKVQVMKSSHWLS